MASVDLRRGTGSGAAFHDLLWHNGFVNELLKAFLHQQRCASTTLLPAATDAVCIPGDDTGAPGKPCTGMSAEALALIGQNAMKSMLDDIDVGPGLLPEMLELFAVIELLGDNACVTELATVSYRSLRFPVVGLTLGPADRKAPVLALFAGVHGLERIGTRVVLSYLRALGNLLQWDSTMHALLQRVRIVAIPIVNPLGMYLQRRSNANGVDLMRNAPCDAEGLPGWYLPGGHRLSARLPWFRGVQDAGMEIEAAVLCKFVMTELFPAELALSVDVHSGYGTCDRLWFPYARTCQPFPQRAAIMLLKERFEAAYPYHIYSIEPQSRRYRAHGDLWDYLYDKHQVLDQPNIFLPFTLELGSWIWMKKSIRQVFSLFGVFNPIAKHRQRRTLRRHVLLFDFMARICNAAENFAAQAAAQRQALDAQAQREWYAN